MSSFNAFPFEKKQRSVAYPSFSTRSVLDAPEVASYPEMIVPIKPLPLAETHYHQPNLLQDHLLDEDHIEKHFFDEDDYDDPFEPRPLPEDRCCPSQTQERNCQSPECPKRVSLTREDIEHMNQCKDESISTDDESSVDCYVVDVPEGHEYLEEATDDHVPSFHTLRQFMQASRASMMLLQDWDRQNGLPKSHSWTMMHTDRSRRQIEEGRILPKWDGTPLIEVSKNGEARVNRKKRKIRTS